MRIIANNRQFYPALAALVLVTISSGFLQTFANILWGRMVDLGLDGLYADMFRVGIFMLVILLIDCLRMAGDYTLAGHTFEGMFVNLRTKVFRVLTQGSSTFMEKDMRSGDIASRINSDMTTLSGIMSGSFMWILRVSFEALIAIIGCFILSWEMALMYLVVLPLSAFAMKKISIPIQNKQKQSASSEGKAASIAADVFRNIELTKTLSLESMMDSRYAEVVNVATNEIIAREKTAAQLTALKYVVVTIQLLFLFGMGAFLIANQRASVGSVLAFITLSASIRNLVELSDNFVGQIRRAEALSERVYEMLEIPLEDTDEIIKEDSALLGDEIVKFDKTHFAYSDGKEVLKGVNIRLKKGQKVGIIGPSGAGKSTIIKLICKFYANAQGNVYLFGKIAEKWAANDLRKKISLVTQDPALFNETIYENVRYGQENATEEEVIAALKDAMLWDYVQNLSNGIHSQIGEYGNQLSGGQRQRLSIARAILKNADLILLDEPTSALDTISEYEIQRSLDKLLEGKTALIVAHRLSTLNRADYIYCLDASGNIAEEGTIEELSNKNGYYQRIKAMQEGGEVS